MTLAIDHIKRLMGWCPQKDFMGHIRTEKNDHYFITSYEIGAYGGKTFKILTDYQWSRVLYAGCVTSFLFLIAGLFFPNLFFFSDLSILSIFLTSVILFVQDRTTMEFSPGVLIIKRMLFKPVEIPGKNILKIEVLKNPNNKFRRASLVIIALIYWSMNIKDTLFRIIVRDPSPFFTYVIFLESTLLIFVTSLFYKWYIRSPYENVLKITSRNKREITIYIDEPYELANKLGLVQ